MRRLLLLLSVVYITSTIVSAQTEQRNVFGPNINAKTVYVSNFDQTLLKDIYKIVTALFKTSNIDKTTISTLDTQLKNALNIKDDKKLGEVLEKLKAKFYLYPGHNKDIAIISNLLALNDANNFRSNRALVEIDEAIKMDPYNIDYPILKARILQISFGKSKSALELLRSYLSISANNRDKFSIYSELGTVSYLNSDTINTVRYFEKCMSITNGSFRNDIDAISSTKLFLAYAYDQKNDSINAVSHFVQAIKSELTRYPRNDTNIAVLYQELASFYTKRENFATAKINFDNASFYLGNIKVDWPIYHLKKGQFYCWNNKQDSAVKYYNLALSAIDKQESLNQKKVDSAIVYLHIAEDYFKLDDYLSVIYYANKAISNLSGEPDLELTPFFAKAYYILGACYFDRQDYKNALVYYSNGINVLDELGWEDNFNDIYACASICSYIVGEDGSKYLPKTEIGSYSAKKKTIAFQFMGGLLLKKGLCKDAISLYNVALDFANEILSTPGDNTVYWLYLDLASAHWVAGNSSLSEHYFDLIHEGKKQLSVVDINALANEESYIRKSVPFGSCTNTLFKK